MRRAVFQGVFVQTVNIGVKRLSFAHCNGQAASSAGVEVLNFNGMFSRLEADAGGFLNNAVRSVVVDNNVPVDEQSGAVVRSDGVIDRGAVGYVQRSGKSNRNAVAAFNRVNIKTVNASFFFLCESGKVRKGSPAPFVGRCRQIGNGRQRIAKLKNRLC